MNGARLLLLLALVDPLVRLDHTIRDAVQHARQPRYERVMHAISDFGRPPVVLGGLFAIAFVDEAAGLLTARATLLALLPVNAVVEVTKYAVNRVRPDGDRRRRNSSFPSSHAANAMALAWMLSRRWPKSAWAFFAAAALVAFSRIYLDRHYFSDVVVASLLGIACAQLMVRRWPVLDPARSRIGNPDERGSEPARLP